VNKARFIKLQQAIALLENVRDEEQDAFDGIPDNFRNSERVQQMETGIECLDNALAELSAFTD
jgi:exonuclease VII small subunit